MAKFCDVVFGTLNTPGAVGFSDHDEDDGADTLAQKVHTITNAAATIHYVSAFKLNDRMGGAVIVWADA